MTHSDISSPLAIEGGDSNSKFTIYEAELGPTARTFFLNERHGCDKSDGFSPESPWKTFQPLKSVSLEPGDRVLLQRGDVWNEQLIIHARGMRSNGILISHYGDPSLGPPRIACPSVDPHQRIESYIRANGEVLGVPIGGFKGLTLKKSLHVKIDGLDFQGGKVGIFVEQDGTIQEGFQVVNCRFFNITAHPDLYFFDTGMSALSPRVNDGRGDRVFWASGIFVGGSLGAYSHPFGGALISDITVSSCAFIGCDTGFGTVIYRPEKPDSPLVRRLALLNSTTFGSLQGSFMLTNVVGAYIRNFSLFSGGGYSATGICGAFLQFCSDIDIVDCAFNGVERRPHAGTGAACHDAVGLDLEGACVDIRLRRCQFVGNAGAGLLLCNADMAFDEQGLALNPNSRVGVIDCIFDRNCLNPDSVDHPERDGVSNFQVLSWQKNATGILQDTVFVRSRIDAGELSANMQGFAAIRIGTASLSSGYQPIESTTSSDKLPAGNKEMKGY